MATPTPDTDAATADFLSCSANAAHHNSPIDVTTDTLKAASSDAEFRLHLAALEWSLADPIVINSLDDVKSKTEWREGFSPFAHQVQNLITFCRCLPVTLLADDVGLGKTISAALILCELMKRRRISRTLVLCPSILCDQWVEELETKVGIFARTAKGVELDRQLRGTCPVIVTTYESGTKRLGMIPPGSFDMLILDEAHKLRNLHGAQQAPQMAVKLQHALQHRLFKYVLMLTATPIHNRLWDLYSLISCLTVAKGHKNPLGEPGQFSATYIADGAAARRLRPGTQQQFREILRQYVVRTRRQDAGLVFPERVVDLFSVQATPAEIEMQRAIAEHIGEMNGLLQTSVLTALMSSPEALLGQLENMAAKNSRYRNLTSKIRLLVAQRMPFAKLQGLRNIIDLLRAKRPDDWRVLVFTGRTETQAAIGRMLESEGIAFGFISGGQPIKNARTIRQFMADRPEVSVVISTDAGAEGVNLQKCNVLVNYDLPWNPMVVEQRIGRVQRLASAHQYVSVFNLCIADSPEQRVVTRLMEKLQTISETVGDIEAILETTCSDAKDTAESFASQVRKLVVESLRGQNVELAMRKTEASLALGKQMLKERAEELDQALGRLDEMHTVGPAAPKVARTEPRIPYREFVERALTARGAQLKNLEDGLVRASFTDRPDDEIAFDEDVWRSRAVDGVFQGRAPKLYMPGKPDFERLIQHWIDHASHRVAAKSGEETASLELIASKWLQQVCDAELISTSFETKRRTFAGAITAKASVHNSVDSYEKLIVVPLEEALSHLASSFRTGAEGFISENLNPAEAAAGLRDVVKLRIEQDIDVLAFSDFYAQRLREELAKTAGSSVMRKKVENDFLPTIHGNVAALEGELRAVGNITVNFTVDGEGSYSTTLEGCPVTGEILQSPPLQRCEETSRMVPTDCLGSCELTGKRVLQHLLLRSPESGRAGLKSLAVRCEASGDLVFEDEASRCAVTGWMARRSLLQPSSLSGRDALRTELRYCEFSGDAVLPEELLVSEISGKKCRADQACRSGVSNRLGHHSEFIKCATTGDFIVESEAIASEVSGRLVRHDQLVASEKPPHRRGASDEAVRCAVTGHLLLKDEVETSVVSGKIADAALFAASDASGRLALPDELVTCVESGKQVLPEEATASAVSGQLLCKSLALKSALSGRLARQCETAACEITHDLVLADELLVSEFSAKRFRKDLAVESALSHRVGARSESVQCEYTGIIILEDEAGFSDLTSKVASVTVLTPSEKSGRLGVASAGELIACEQTGRKLLRDELMPSASSGKLVDRDLLIASDESGKLALPEELFVCEATSTRMLPEEALQSDVSGKIVRRSLLRSSAIPGRRGLDSETVRCELTGDIVLVDELEVSDVSVKRFRRDQKAVSEVSGRSGHTSETQRCEYTDRLLLQDEAGQSAVTQRTTWLNNLVSSEKSGRLGAASGGEVVVCAVTHRRLLKDEVASCEVTGKEVDADLLTASEVSGRRALSDQMVRCGATRQQALPDELAVSDVSGMRVVAGLLRKSAMSELRGLQAELKQCAFSNQWVTPDELVLSQYSNKPCRQDESERSEMSGRIAHRSEFGQCGYSRRRLIQDELSTSDVTGKPAGRDILVRSQHSGRWGVRTDGEVLACEKSGKLALLDEMEVCAVTGKRVLKQLLYESAVSGKKALPAKMEKCEQSGVSLLPEEAAICEISKKRVDRRLLVNSEISGRRCLKEFVRQCAVTKQRGLLDEVQTCEVSKKLVVVHKLKKCFISGLVANEDLMVASAESGQWMLRTHALQCSAQPGYFAPSELTQCAWLEVNFPRSRTKVCQWTELQFASHLMTAGNYMSILGDLMAGKAAGQGGAHLGEWLKQESPELFRGLHAVTLYPSPQKGLFAFKCEIRYALGLRTRIAAFFASQRPSPHIVGKIAIFEREGKMFKLRQSIEVGETVK